MSIAKKHFTSMFKTGKRVFVQENKRFNGVMKFAFVDDTDTGEAVFYVPDKTTADRIKALLDVEFSQFK